MEIKLQKWGNSEGIRIPSAIIKSLNIKENDKLELIEKDNKIIIYKVEQEKISLKEEFATYNGENISKEYEWDEAKGREIW